MGELPSRSPQYHATAPLVASTPFHFPGKYLSQFLSVLFARTCPRPLLRCRPHRKPTQRHPERPLIRVRIRLYQRNGIAWGMGMRLFRRMFQHGMGMRLFRRMFQHGMGMRRFKTYAPVALKHCACDSLRVKVV